MAFNLKRQAQTESKHYDEYLEDNRKELGNEANKEPGNIDYELQQVQKSHKKVPTDQITQEQLSDKRAGTNDGVLEKALNENPDLYNKKRTDKAYATTVKANDLVSESYDQKIRGEFVKAEDAQDRDTSFWDDYVGDQRIGEKQTIINNVQKSQLENHKDRFDGLDKTMATDEDQSVNRGRIDTPDKFYKMVTADSMLFHIYATAASQGRDVNEEEAQKINDINSGKARVLGLTK